jgi:hypothetical protein
MPGYLGGGGSSSGGTGGEIRFPKEFIDPVTKLRVSNPENLIDTDFEYGLQPTKWETVELINNTPSFFSKSGDTTIDAILSITTNAGTREITVKTGLDHQLAVGIPIQVTGTKSTTADGSYIINSLPNATTFTYLCKDDQETTASIEDLYSSIITGEFFQGSQLRISDEAGILTDGGAVSTLTVTTDSTHGFGINTPFYFLNINSTISQEFQAANTETKSFDASNSATAQTFDGSNTLSSINIDFSNSAVVGGVTSNVTSTSPAGDTVTVQHGSENFSGQPLGTALYYDVVAGSGFFAANPRGVVFIKDVAGLGTLFSAFSLSEVPDGDVIDITGSMSGTFQLANQARTFAGNNVGTGQQLLDVISDAPVAFDGANDAGLTATILGYSGSTVTIQAAASEVLSWYYGSMVFYESTGNASQNLTDNTTYFIGNFSRQGGTDLYSVTLSALPNGGAIQSLQLGTGTETLKQIGISADKDIFHVKDHGLQTDDMVQYSNDAGSFASDQTQNFYFVQTRYDQHNIQLTYTLGEVSPATQSRIGTDAGTTITPTTVTAVGFVDPKSWAVSSGTLPSGLTLNTTTGVISGASNEVIASPGREVVITLTDSAGSTGSQTITFQFNQPPFLYAFSSATFTSGGRTQRSGPDIGTARSGVGNPNWASTYLNMSTNGIQRWTVPQSGTFRIRAAGAYASSGGGWGAVIQSDHSLTQGEIVNIVVGQTTTRNTSGGGGGGSIVWRDSGTNLLIAAGGGGGSYSGGYDSGVMDGNFNQNGKSSSTGESGGSGGGGGQGGQQCSGYGGGGGGWNGNGSNGQNCGDTYGRGRGENWLGGGTCNQIYGGFGGGGGTHGNSGGGGGGGGYSGGGGQGHCGTGSGGGGSYSATGQSNIGTNSSSGYVTITKI